MTTYGNELFASPTWAAGWGGAMDSTAEQIPQPPSTMAPQTKPDHVMFNLTRISNQFTKGNTNAQSKLHLA
jgi:hypothetical protein